MFSNQKAIPYPTGHVKAAETILQEILSDRLSYLSDMMKHIILLSNSFRYDIWRLNRISHQARHVCMLKKYSKQYVKLHT